MERIRVRGVNGTQRAIHLYGAYAATRMAVRLGVPFEHMYRELFGREPRK